MFDKIYSNITKIVVVFFVLGINSSSFGQSIYTNDMDYVLGDTKQRFITGAVTTQEQADNLLKGFKTMKVNGIRIPIFPVGANPQPDIMDYFFDQAIAQGFPIFANPAQDSGGRRIASGSLKSADMITTRDVPEATETLINVVSQFALDHPGLKWINPFNEDGKPGDGWSAVQMNAIYSGVKANMESYYSDGLIPNVPELVGPCVWGLPASILVMKNTNIAEYITVATSHNLGFNHGRWGEFITLADAENLPVWDSEVNNSNNGGVTRIDAAIANEVDGLVIYNSGNTINLSTGNVGAANEVYMSKYLKQRTNLALAGIATQSVSTAQWDMEASRAIDGNIAGGFSGGNGSITHTAGINPWWQLDLGSDKELEEIKIFNRTDNGSKENLSNFTVSVANTNGNLVFTETFSDYPDQALVVKTGDIIGRIIKIKLNATRALTLAEVQVFGPEDNLSVENFVDVDVAVYPNPVIDILSVITDDSQFDEFMIYNINGQNILRGEVHNKSKIEIDLSNLSKGVYLLQLKGGIYNKIQKFIKN